MTETETYPECLRRPDAGGHLQTRTRKTEAGYRERYEGMAKTWCRQHRMDVVTPFELAIDIGYRASKLSENALKQYHATVRQHLRDLWDEGAITDNEVERVDALLRQQTPMPKAVKGKASKKTLAGRARSVKPETLSALIGELLRSPTPIRRIAAAQLEYGVHLATRPGEFLTMREDPIGRLWVRSAKYSETNKKGLQPVRMLIVDTLETFEIGELKEIAALLLTERANGATTSSLLRRCQHAIREARKGVGGRSGKVTAYTVPPSGAGQYGGIRHDARGGRRYHESCQRHDRAIPLCAGAQRLEGCGQCHAAQDRSRPRGKSPSGQQISRLDRQTASWTEAEVSKRGECAREINRKDGKNLCLRWIR